ncbi:MAG: hypothetical protein M1832_000491 [Thelocarpon impressellum]|nr:MAG: hypothetical protein M1832_000491 [Thelocarpon impressellum]
MLSSLLRPKGDRRARHPFASSPPSEASPLIARPSRQHATADFEDTEDSEALDDEDAQDNGDEDEDVRPLLPIFSAAHLDSLPVYHLTHTIRLLVVSRCETTLSWDQLRSPQVSQFLVKPIQLQIRHSHFSSATLYALMANCLQFAKESTVNPGNSGTTKTRSLVCQLLAIKLLREFTTRELIDALSYDFFPLQGLAPPVADPSVPGVRWDPPFRTRAQPRPVRVSTLEIAIRAQAKRFLAHPLVVRHLEAIWAGTIVFHSSADNLHRPAPKVLPNHDRGYGTNDARPQPLQVSPDKVLPTPRTNHSDVLIRRSVTLYDPRDASLFKLSRLRVPRYRQTLSTISYAVLLGLFLAVLIERSLEITTLEVIFWFWSAGFMLDEVVGFNEQGFSLYIMSFWNAFDLGILLLLIFFYILRLYGLTMPSRDKARVAAMAYDTLAANAVLLFPRLFSVLDHYRYFSQLLIAFRLMAIDLIAVFVLILIACSGFFVAFTLSFGRGFYDAPDVAYKLFQILLGFTPAAWNDWEEYNMLGKGILTLFLFICHFLIVTILITVLTNSFMAIVANANEEHQFVFAVNTIAMVKSDALFSYIAPTNVIAWLLAPLRYVISFRHFVRLNRTVIKFTHFPVLFTIYSYERLVLRNVAFELTDLIEYQPGRHGRRTPFAPSARTLFSPRGRMREESVVGYQKDRALEEVFRVPFKDATTRHAERSQERRKTSNVVNNWMRGMGSDGRASPPPEQDHSIVERLEARKLSIRRSQRYGRRLVSGTRQTEATRSVASDPEEAFVVSVPWAPGSPWHRHRAASRGASVDILVQPTEADGDDELASTEDQETTPQTKAAKAKLGIKAADYFAPASYLPSETSAPPPTRTRSGAKAPHAPHGSLDSPAPPRRVSQTKEASRVAHLRNSSSTTVVYNPTPVQSARESVASPRKVGKKSPGNGDAEAASSAAKKSPRKVTHTVAKPRPIMPPRSNALQSAPNLAGLVMMDQRHPGARASSLGLDLTSDIGNDFHQGANVLGAVPSSFATQMAMATGAVRASRQVAGDDNDSRMMSRLMLARMKTLEEGFHDILREVKAVRGESRSGDGDERKEKTTQKVKRYHRGKDSREYRKQQQQRSKPRSADEQLPVITASPSAIEHDYDAAQKIREKSSSL